MRPWPRWATGFCALLTVLFPRIQGTNRGARLTRYAGEAAMKTLRRKLLRELNQMKGQVASIALVVAAGIAVMVSMAGALSALQGATTDFYQSSRLADLFVTLVRAPEPLAERIRELNGVASVETRVVVEARLVFEESG